MQWSTEDDDVRRSCLWLARNVIFATVIMMVANIRGRASCNQLLPFEEDQNISINEQRQVEPLGHFHLSGTRQEKCNRQSWLVRAENGWLYYFSPQRTAETTVGLATSAIRKSNKTRATKICLITSVRTIIIRSLHVISTTSRPPRNFFVIGAPA